MYAIYGEKLYATNAEITAFAYMDIGNIMVGDMPRKSGMANSAMMFTDEDLIPDFERLVHAKALRLADEYIRTL